MSVKRIVLQWPAGEAAHVERIAALLQPARPPTSPGGPAGTGVRCSPDPSVVPCLRRKILDRMQLRRCVASPRRSGPPFRCSRGGRSDLLDLSPDDFPGRTAGRPELDESDEPARRAEATRSGRSGARKCLARARIVGVAPARVKPATSCRGTAPARTPEDGDAAAGRGPARVGEPVAGPRGGSREPKPGSPDRGCSEHDAAGEFRKPP